MQVKESREKPKKKLHALAKANAFDIIIEIR